MILRLGKENVREFVYWPNHRGFLVAKICGFFYWSKSERVFYWPKMSNQRRFSVLTKIREVLAARLGLQLTADLRRQRNAIQVPYTNKQTNKTQVQQQTNNKGLNHLLERILK